MAIQEGGCMGSDEGKQDTTSAVYFLEEGRHREAERDERGEQSGQA
jgi:hypothetical protein